MTVIGVVDSGLCYVRHPGILLQQIHYYSHDATLYPAETYGYKRQPGLAALKRVYDV